MEIQRFCTFFFWSWLESGKMEKNLNEISDYSHGSMERCREIILLFTVSTVVWFISHYPDQRNVLFPHQVYKQKMKHVLCEHQNMMSGLQSDAVVYAEAMEKEREELEAGIHLEQEAIAVDMQDVESEKLAWEIELVCGTHHPLNVILYQWITAFHCYSFFLSFFCKSQQKHNEELTKLKDSGEKQLAGKKKKNPNKTSANF